MISYGVKGKDDLSRPVDETAPTPCRASALERERPVESGRNTHAVRRSKSAAWRLMALSIVSS